MDVLVNKDVAYNKNLDDLIQKIPNLLLFLLK